MANISTASSLTVHISTTVAEISKATAENPSRRQRH
jgi:hypothetical protein